MFDRLIEPILRDPLLGVILFCVWVVIVALGCQLIRDTLGETLKLSSCIACVGLSLASDLKWSSAQGFAAEAGLLAAVATCLWAACVLNDTYFCNVSGVATIAVPCVLVFVCGCVLVLLGAVSRGLSDVHVLRFGVLGMAAPFSVFGVTIARSGHRPAP